MFDVLSRLKELQDAKGVSSYKLAKISDTPKSTISGWKSAKRPPGIEKLEQICTNVLGISLAQFFDMDNALELTAGETLMLGKFRKLSPEAQEIVQQHLENLSSLPALCSGGTAYALSKGDDRSGKTTAPQTGEPYSAAVRPEKDPSPLMIADKPEFSKLSGPGKKEPSGSGKTEPSGSKIIALPETKKKEDKK